MFQGCQSKALRQMAWIDVVSGELRATDIDRRIAELQGLRADLTRLAKRARRLDPADCDPASICHIISTPVSRSQE